MLSAVPGRTACDLRVTLGSACFLLPRTMKGVMIKGRILSWAATVCAIAFTWPSVAAQNLTEAQVALVEDNLAQGATQR